MSEYLEFKNVLANTQMDLFSMEAGNDGDQE